MKLCKYIGHDVTEVDGIHECNRCGSNSYYYYSDWHPSYYSWTFRKLVLPMSIIPYHVSRCWKLKRVVWPGQNRDFAEVVELRVHNWLEKFDPDYIPF